MSQLRVCLFGKFRVHCGEQTPVNLTAHKVQELFSYLLLHRDHPQPREALASLLWGNCPTTQSKKYLRQALWQLQTTLRSPGESVSGPVLLLEPEWIQLHPEADVYLDVAAFEQACDLVQGKPGHALDAPSVEALRTAVRLYQGDLLEGWYQDWCLYERERLQNMYLALLDKLTEYCEATNDSEAGLVSAALILRYDPASERTHRRMMRLYCMARNRTAALRQYERCVSTLREELGVEPAERTRQLYEQIRADRLDSPAQPVEMTHAASAVPTAALLGVLGHLRQIQAALSDTQRWVQREIQRRELSPSDPC